MAKVVVSIGSNVDRENNIRSCLDYLSQRFNNIQTSVVYENKAVGFEGDNFYNLVAAFETDLDVAEMIPIFRAIESEHGRVRGGEKFSSRTLDVDLLLYDDLVLKDQGIDVPRDEIIRYAFVLRPLAEMIPDMMHPQLKQTMSELWQNFEPKEKMWQVDIAAS